jgi:hypothetical protein
VWGGAVGGGLGGGVGGWQLAELARGRGCVLKTLHKLKAETVEMDSEIQQYHEQLAKFAKR